MEESKINVEVTLTTEDVYNFHKAVFYKNWSPVQMIFISIVLLVVAAAAIIGEPPLGSNPILTVLLIFLALLILVIAPIALKKGAVNAFKTNKLIQKTQNYEIGTEGISASSETGQGFIRWNEFYKADESKDSFLFFISKRQAYILPKRCLNDTQQFEFLRICMKNAPAPKEYKLFRKVFKFGCLIYFFLLIVILVVINLYY